MAAQINYDDKVISTQFGQITFGEVDNSNVVAGITIRAGTPSADAIPHYIKMDNDGDSFQKGRRGTIAVCPGTFQIVAGQAVRKGIPGVFIDSNNGDLVLRSDGRIRLIAQDVDIVAKGGGLDKGGNPSGHVQVLAGQNIIMNAKQSALLNGDAYCAIRSETKCEVIGESLLNMYGGLIEMFDGASTIKGSRSIIPFLPATPRELLQALSKALK
tara:strand:- start:266 stop:907 length:642 start_codon:yes stop_codon:yes gene_type:complete